MTGRLFASPFFNFFSSRFCLPPGEKSGLVGHDGEAVCESFFQVFLLQGFVFLLEGSQACPVMTGRLFASPFFKFFFQDFVFLLEGRGSN